MKRNNRNRPPLGALVVAILLVTLAVLSPFGEGLTPATGAQTDSPVWTRVFEGNVEDILVDPDGGVWVAFEGTHYLKYLPCADCAWEDRQLGSEVISKDLEWDPRGRLLIGGQTSPWNLRPGVWSCSWERQGPDYPAVCWRSTPDRRSTAPGGAARVVINPTRADEMYVLVDQGQWGRPEGGLAQIPLPDPQVSEVYWPYSQRLRDYAGEFYIGRELISAGGVWNTVYWPWDPEENLTLSLDSSRVYYPGFHGVVEAIARHGDPISGGTLLVAYRDYRNGGVSIFMTDGATTVGGRRVGRVVWGPKNVSVAVENRTALTADDNYIWLGTEEGVVQIDALSRETVVRWHRNVTDVTTMAVDRFLTPSQHHRLWVGTTNGLWLWDPEGIPPTETPVPPPTATATPVGCDGPYPPPGCPTPTPELPTPTATPCAPYPGPGCPTPAYRIFLPLVVQSGSAAPEATPTEEPIPLPGEPPPPKP